jgi:hypothetical protein
MRQTSQSERKRIRIKRQSGNARATQRRVILASYRRQEGWRARAKPSPPTVLVHPEEPQRRSPVDGTQATATPLRPAQTAATSARSDRRTYTGRQRQGHTGTNRAYRRNAAHRDTQTTRDRTPSDRERTAEATRQKTPTHGTLTHQGNGRSPPTHARIRAKRRAPGTTEPKTETPDAQAKRPPTHKRPPQTPQQESSPGTGTDHATRTRNPGKPRLTDTPEEEASEADAARPNGDEKHRDSRKGS